MWHEIHWFRAFEKYALYVGTPNGYIIGKLYSNKVSARLSALIHGYKYCVKETAQR